MPEQPLTALPSPEDRKQAFEKWPAALRSGEFKQGRGQLQRGRGAHATHCCLGVYAVLTKGGELVYTKPEEDPIHTDGDWVYGDEDVAVEEPHRLTARNDAPDGDGLTFAEIADYIETHYAWDDDTQTVVFKDAL